MTATPERGANPPDGTAVRFAPSPAEGSRRETVRREAGQLYDMEEYSWHGATAGTRGHALSEWIRSMLGKLQATPSPDEDPDLQITYEEWEGYQAELQRIRDRVDRLPGESVPVPTITPRWEPDGTDYAVIGKNDPWGDPPDKVPMEFADAVRTTRHQAWKDRRWEEMMPTLRECYGEIKRIAQLLGVQTWETEVSSSPSRVGDRVVTDAVKMARRGRLRRERRRAGTLREVEATRDEDRHVGGRIPISETVTAAAIDAAATRHPDEEYEE